jgi:hypothetical protein
MMTALLSRYGLVFLDPLDPRLLFRFCRLALRVLHPWKYHRARQINLLPLSRKSRNRVGEEKGFRFIGQSRIVDVTGELLAKSDDDRPAILYAEIDPARAREKLIVKIPKLYELHRIAHRRPELYDVLCKRTDV